MYLSLEDVRGQQMNHVQTALQRFKCDTAYYEAHHAALLERYPEQWIAIYNQQVVGIGPDYEQLLSLSIIIRSLVPDRRHKRVLMLHTSRQASSKP